MLMSMRLTNSLNRRSRGIGPERGCRVFFKFLSVAYFQIQYKTGEVFLFNALASLKMIMNNLGSGVRYIMMSRRQEKANSRALVFRSLNQYADWLGGFIYGRCEHAKLCKKKNESILCLLICNLWLFLFMKGT